MNLKFLPLILLSVLIISCGKKDEQVQQQDTTQQQTVQQTEPQITQQTEQQQKKDTASVTDKAKQEEKKKEEEKIKEVEKKKEEKKKEEEKKKQETEQKKNDDASANDIDFSQIFPKKCAKCHGKDLKGKVEGVPDLTGSKTQNKSDQELIKIITNGKKGKTEDDEDMPSFKNKLTEDEIKAAVKYVKSH